MPPVGIAGKILPGPCRMAGMTATALRGNPVAAVVRDDVATRAETLRERGTRPTLGTVLMSEDPAPARFMELKHDACAAVGIETRDRRVSPDDAATTLYETVTELSGDSEVDAVFVQTPLPEHVDRVEVGRRLDPEKDVDCFHPENVGRLIGAEPRFVPATTAAIVRLLAHYDVPTAGRHAVIVGRSPVIGRPIANRLLWDDDPGNATVTVCHSRTSDLAVHTRRADLLVTACGVPELIDGSMLTEGVVVVDVSANRIEEGGDSTVVGDVAAEGARSKARAITPVPGGVGPVTLAALLENVVRATERLRSS